MLLKYWPQLTAGATLLVTLVGAIVSLTRERDALLHELAGQCRRIEVLERIAVEQFPAYSPAMYYTHAPMCRW